MNTKRYFSISLAAMVGLIAVLLVNGPISAQSTSPKGSFSLQQETATTDAPTSNDLLDPSASIDDDTINGKPIGPSPKIPPPPTLDQILQKYPDLEPYLTKIEDLDVINLDFAELYAKIAEISDVQALATFLSDSDLLYKLDLPLSYIDLVRAYGKGGLDALKKLATQNDFLNDDNEIIGFLTLDDPANLESVTNDETNLGVSVYDYDDTTDEVEIGIPLDKIEQAGTPDALLKYLTQVANVNHVDEFNEPGSLGPDNLSHPLHPSFPLFSLQTPAVKFVGPHTIGADKWQKAGFTGKGVRIGVLDQGFGGIQNDLGKTLPATVTTNLDISQLNGQPSKHGTACAEIVHAAAPDADLFIAYMDGTLSSLSKAVAFLAKNNVQIISYSVGIAFGPRDGLFGDASRVNAFTKKTGILWVSAAGNEADVHSRLKFQPDSDNNAIFGKNKEGQALVNYLPFRAGSDMARVTLNWDGNWKGGETSEYDLTVYDQAGNVVAVGANLRKGRKNDLPYQMIEFASNPGDTYFLVVHRKSGDVSNILDVFMHHGAIPKWAMVSGYSLASPGDAANALTVGATVLTKDALEDYSSQGPTSDGRIKPDLVAPTGEILPEYGDKDGFNGTSGATPLVAGAAALVFQRFPSLSATDVKAYLIKHVVDLGVRGPDNKFGAGRLALPDPLFDKGDIPTPAATLTP